MALTNCPMCGSFIGNAEIVKTCSSCGADLLRSIPKSPTPPPLPTPQAGLETESVSKASGEFNLGLGVAGAVGGAVVGMGLMYGFYAVTNVRFPLLGVGTGFLTGFAAKRLFKGSDHTLGIISAGAAMLGVLGALLLMYGLDFSPLNIISVMVSASVAYKVASR